MARIRTEELLDRVAKGNFKAIRLRVVSGNVFVMLLECDDGIFVHEHSNGNTKEYPSVDNALRWLKRATKVNEVIIDIAFWRLYD